MVIGLRALLVRARVYIRFPVEHNLGPVTRFGLRLVDPVAVQVEPVEHRPAGFPVGRRIALQVVFRLDAVDVADVFFRRDDEQMLVGPAVLAQQHAVGSRSQRLDIGYALLRRDLEFPDLETQDGRRRRYLFVVITAVREEIIQGEPFLGCPQTRLRQKRRPK